MTWCPADDAQICDDCGALIADGRRPEHTRFHEVVLSLSLDGLKRLKESAESPGEVTPGDYEELRSDVRDLAAALTRILAERPPTPADAHALQERADRERRDFAWLHHCGVLNHGYWSPGSMCTGCRFSVDKADHVDAHYRLVAVEGLGDEGQA